jgi:cytidylate kinase
MPEEVDMYQRTGSSARLVEALGQAHHHWETRHGAEETPASASHLPPFTIAISREAGAGGAVIAQEIGRRLGWPVYDRELLQQIAEEMGLHTRLLESVDEKRGSLLREWVEAFAAVPAVHKGAYVHRLVKTLLSLAAHGKCVIVGRAAAQVLPAETTLRVRLVGSPEARAKSAAQRLGLSPEEASKWTSATDQERLEFVRQHFHRDAADPRHYDVVLNSSRFAVGECAELIIDALHRLEGHAQARTQIATPASASSLP